MRAVLSVALLAACAVTASADDKEDIAKATKDLKSKDVKVRLLAVEKLAGLGTDAARPLCDAMLDQNIKVAKAALAGLEKVSPKLYKPLTTLALDENEDNTHRAIKDIGKLGKDGRPAFGFLVARYKNELARKVPGRVYANEAAWYLISISEIGGDSEECVTFFKSVAKSTHITRKQAIQWLVEWAGDDADRRKELLPIIKVNIADSNEAVYFINLAGKYGELSKEFLPTLKKLKLSKDASVRDASTKAVGLIEAP